MSENEKFAISEVKDYAAHTLTTISNTRDKCWQLVAYISAIDIYLITSFIENKTSQALFGLSIGAAVYTFIMFYLLWSSLWPSELAVNGTKTETAKQLAANENEDICFDATMERYKRVIDKNEGILSSLVSGYRNAAQFLFGFILFAIFLFFLFVFIKA